MRWSYKTVRFDMKKEGLLGSAFLDESEIEITLNDFGEVGWELISLLEVQDGIIGVFKQPFAEGVIPLKNHADEKVYVGEGGSPRSPSFLKDTAVDSQGKENREGSQPPAEVSESEAAVKKRSDVGSIRIE